MQLYLIGPVLFALALALFGVVRNQGRRYWLHAYTALVSHVAFGALMQAGGTLEDPSQDGPITVLVRHATEDGILFAVYGFFFVLPLVWGLPIDIARRGYTKNVYPSQE